MQSVGRRKPDDGEGATRSRSGVCAELARHTAHEAVPLNALIGALLASGIGWKSTLGAEHDVTHVDALKDAGADPHESFRSQPRSPADFGRVFIPVFILTLFVAVKHRAVSFTAWAGSLREEAMAALVRASGRLVAKHATGGA